MATTGHSGNWTSKCGRSLYWSGVSVSYTQTTATVKGTLKMRSAIATDDSSNSLRFGVTTSSGAAFSGLSYKKNLGLSGKAGKDVTVASGSWTVTRDDAAKTVYLAARLYDIGPSDKPYDIWVYGHAVTIAARTRYTVSFDGNGGSWGGTTQVSYGRGCALDKTSSRDHFTFDGWSESPGGERVTSLSDVTGNRTVYARWVARPVATVTKLTAYRVASAGSTTEDPMGTCAYVSCTWAVSNAAASSAIGISLANGITADRSEGTTTATEVNTYWCRWWVAQPEGTERAYRAIPSGGVADSDLYGGSAVVGKARLPLDMSPNGVGIGMVAEDGTLNVGYPIRCADGIDNLAITQGEIDGIWNSL